MKNQKISAEVLGQAKSKLVEVAHRYLDGIEKNGKDYLALCPFHSEKTPSFTVSEDKEFFYCFGCGASGDAIDLVSHFDGTNLRDSVKTILGDGALKEGYVAPKRKHPPAKREEQFKAIIPVPDSVPMPMSILRRKGKDGEWLPHKAVAQWAYRDAGGQLIGYVNRFDLGGGRKEVMPQTYCVETATGECAWRYQAFPEPRPLYGMELLAQHPGAQVLLVEGEKTRDAAAELIAKAGIGRDRLIALSWPGGGNAVHKVDWGMLSCRNVGLWPDADRHPYKEGHALAGTLMPRIEQPGYRTMLDIAALLEPLDCKCKIVLPPDGVPDGWDLADPMPDGFEFLAHLRGCALPLDLAVNLLSQEAEAMLPKALPGAEPQPPAPPEDDGDEPEELIKNAYFTILGYDGGHYFIFQHEKRQVLSVTKGDFSDIGLIELAPANWWEENFPGEKGVNRKMAANWLFRTANGRGVYDPSRIRGRGAWVDKGRHVYHHGDYLTVDGVPVEIHRMQSGYVYPTARRMPEPSGTMLTDEEGRHLLDVAGLVRWSMPASAALMAGWTMLAPICGSLRWRPHIWMTGAAGTGKSTLQRDYCSALTLGISVYAQGNSTEAGIRQRLKADALPVLLDEAECNNDRERQRMENILSLIRQSSSESQAETLKGTVSGDSMNFHVRSMFCLASINTTLVQKADIDRMTKLSIRSPGDSGKDNWVELENELIKITKDETIPHRLLARALKMLPVIHKNIAVFVRVAAKHFGSQRDGDQFGTLLAGCYSLISTTEATEAQAQAMIDYYNWQEHVEDHEQDDSSRAMQSILGARVRMPGNVGELSIYELVRETSAVHRDGIVDALQAEATLRRHGIVPDLAAGQLLFGVTTPSLRELVEHTNFATDLRGQLLRVPGAKRHNVPVSFAGVKSRCISVPLDPILGAPPSGAGFQDEYPI